MKKKNALKKRRGRTSDKGARANVKKRKRTLSGLSRLKSRR